MEFLENTKNKPIERHQFGQKDEEQDYVAHPVPDGLGTSIGWHFQQSGRIYGRAFHSYTLSKKHSPARSWLMQAISAKWMEGIGSKRRQFGIGYLWKPTRKGGNGQRGHCLFPAG